MAPIRHQPRHARQAAAQSTNNIGPYPVEFCDNSQIGPTCGDAKVISRSSRRLFARDFQFTEDQVARWMAPQNKVPRGSDKWADLVATLKKQQGIYQHGMFGSHAIIKHVFDFVRSYEQNHPNEPRIKDMTKVQREPIWNTAFTNEIAKAILKPLAMAVKVDDFLNINVWKQMYQAMFAAAAEVIYMEADPSKRRSDGYPKVNGHTVYAAVRKVPNEKFPHRPQFDHIPTTSFW